MERVEFVKEFIQKCVQFEANAEMKPQKLYEKYVKYSKLPTVCLSSSGCLFDELGFIHTFGNTIKSFPTNHNLEWKNKRRKCYRIKILESIDICPTPEEPSFFEECEEDIEESISEEYEENIEGSIFEDTKDQPNSEAECMSSEETFLLEDLNNSECSADEGHSCEGVAVIVEPSEEVRFQALKTLGFSDVSLQKLGFEIYFLKYHECSCLHFLTRKNIKEYLPIGSSNALVISLDTPKFKYFLVCAVIANEPTMMKKKKEYGKILLMIRRYCRQQRRGQQIHACKGAMYAYGFRSERRVTNGFGKYAFPPVSKKNPVTLEENIAYNHQLETIVKHYTTIYQQYFPNQAQHGFQMKDNYHAPTIANTHVGNLTVTHSFQSAPHVDPDVSYAFGAWFDSGKGTISGGEFTFPEYRLAIQIHDGICICWHSTHAQHATIASNSYGCTRIGTSMQLNQTLCNKALRSWKKHH